jgi:hypothetical protein
MMHELIGKEVEVETSETLYRGELVEVTEEEIHLRSHLGWITIPIEKVAGVKEIEQQ